MYYLWPRAKCGRHVICVYDNHRSSSLTTAVCVALTRARGRDLETSPKQCSFGNQDLSSHSDETKKVRF